MIMGLTGFYASGKSSIANIFKNKGCLVLELDDICKTILKKRKKIIVSYFGSKVLNLSNNKINNKILGKIVFSDRKKLQVLENILYPYLNVEVNRILVKNFSKYENIIIVSAVLYKSKEIENQCQKVIFVKTSLKLCLKRGIKRGFLCRKDILKRFKSQIGLKRARRDVIINNNNDEIGFNMEKKVKKILQKF